MQIAWQEHIVATSDVLRGKPRLKGTRIPVGLVLGYFAMGSSCDEVLQEIPDLTREQIFACFNYARDLASFETVA